MLVEVITSWAQGVVRMKSLREFRAGLGGAVDASPLAAWLKNARLAKGWSVPELADKAGLTSPAVYRIESGTSRRLRAVTREKLEKALGSPVPQDAVKELAEEAEALGALKMISEDGHREALRRRRIKFVVEKGAMARLFRKGTTKKLQAELFRRLIPTRIAGLDTVEKFDKWLCETVESACWSDYSQGGIEEVRWAYFAKLVNIVVYEIVANRELFKESDWERIHTFLHVPIDSTVNHCLFELDSQFPVIEKLKGLSKEKYFEVQHAIRRLAERHKVSPIWFEAAYSSGE
jgi:transcriptional regulator with XRE-family HTH domain